MTADMIIGGVALVVSLTSIIALVLWSRWTIHRIAKRHLHSARDIVRELNHDN